ncbi:MAG: septum formation inhibitor Maf [Lachnospiraceae bacterium]|nr:septum formation inhibitor Maf [Lachnospiraceae bacterium]
MVRIVLASASPRRKELLGMLGLEFEIMVSDVEEVVTETTPNRVVEQLSLQKAEDIFKRLEGDVLVIGADTVVSLDGKILGKPKNEADAVEMLERLQDNEHRVFTGVTLIGRKEGKEFRNTFSEGTVVKFYPMTEEEIHWYVSTKEPMDKAGSYGIQGLGARFVECIHGDYNNVVGLPIARLYQEMKLL